jgi:hypothetical protein
MDLAGPFVLAAVLAAGSVWTYFATKARAAAIVALARELGLHYVPGGMFAGGRMIGQYRGVPVEIEYYQRNAGKSSVPYTRVLALGVDPEIHLASEHVGTKLLQTFTGPDLQMGEAAFDDLVEVRGPLRALVPLLDAETRAAVAAFVFTGHRVGDGAARVEMRGHLIERAAVEPLLQDTTRIADRLRRDFLSPAAIARIAIEDPEPGVRRNALRALRSEDEGLARSTHEAARDDWDPGPRMDALLYLRDYAAIEKQPPADVAAWAALEPDAAVHLVRHVANEALLTGLLGYSQLHEIACARLAAVGGAGAIASLQTYASGVLGSGRAARDAIAAIHARLGHAPGSLSISTAEGGELAEAPESGGLSEKKK